MTCIVASSRRVDLDRFRGDGYSLRFLSPNFPWPWALAMRSSPRCWLLFICLGLGTGCVERRYIITTDPPGAIVYRNGQYLGATPVDDHFTYYGKYHFTIVKPGFETLQVDQEIPTPWYEYVPIDFVSENLVPWNITDRREFHFQLEPRRVVNTNDLLNQAQGLRNKGMTLGPATVAQKPEALQTPGVEPGSDGR